MCFIEKMNCIMICKREDRIPDLVRTPGQVGYWGTSFSHLVVSKPRFRRLYKMIFEIVCDVHCVCI